MRLLLAAAGLLLAQAAADGRPAAQDRPSPEAIAPWTVAQTERWYAAFNAGDTAALIELYAPEAVLLLEDRQFQGRDAIEAFHRTTFEQVDFTCTWAIETFITVGRLTVVSGTDSCAETPKRGGQVRNWQGRWLTVYQQRTDGSWMIVRDSGAETRPPGSAAPPPVVL